MCTLAGNHKKKPLFINSGIVYLWRKLTGISLLGPFSPCFSSSQDTNIDLPPPPQFPVIVYSIHQYIVWLPFSLHNPCLDMILTIRFWSTEVQQRQEYCCQAPHWALLMLKGTLWGCLALPFRLWARLHLADAITRLSCHKETRHHCLVVKY